MLLRVVHTTTYLYAETVPICHTEVRLIPRSGRNQTLREHELAIDPPGGSSVARQDYFGNAVTMLTIDVPHRTLRIAARSLVEMHDHEPIHPALTQPWEQARDILRQHQSDAAFDAFQFVFESPRVPLAPEFAAYAEPSFPAGRPLLEGALDLCHRIFIDFKYDREATTVATSVEEVLRARHGVCQDFAHVMIACLRSLGLPARYVSGYLRTGEAIGAHASHAWLSIFSPRFGWMDLDPTNDVIPSTRHVTLGWGRDYSDVAPVKGVALGGGKHTIEVDVEVRPDRA
ncbi:MAG TPA: transglutaminase [Deltaproteobacteria bacterium]|jgi:transglutaminase-like putative cysteine protease|nr:transglutaminase [Deltaproteobacteria bacterium]